MEGESAGDSTLERRLTRLAFDLHDGALQELSALAGELASARSQILPVVEEEYRVRAGGRFDDLQARLEALDRSLRSFVEMLRGGGEPSESLDTRIAREVATLRDATGIEPELEISGSFAELTEARRIVIYQVVRQALANAGEHSGARHVRVRVAERQGGVEVSVEDDGCGFDRDEVLRDAPAALRFGLTGMVERLRMLGGELELETAPGCGTRVGFVLEPLEPQGGAPGP
jgi:signal transduction histidine kinase